MNRSTSQPLFLLCALAVAALLGAGCDDGGSASTDPDASDTALDQSPPPDTVEGACGDQVCNLNQVCDESNVEPVCRCLEGYVGDDCTACASGWAPDDSGRCTPGELDCVTQPFACRPHGTCELSPEGLSSCQCDDGYDGRFCETCAEGYQDHAGPGQCLPGCELAGLSCTAPQVCDDATGTPRCACPRGTTGDACELCAAGYRRDETGSCVATCAVASLSCEAPRVCVEGDAGATCGCPRGRTGDDCTGCAPGWVATATGCSPGCDVLTALGACTDGTCAEDDAGVASCTCATGFAGVDCTACAWGHVGARCAQCDTNSLRVGDEACQPACVSHDDACPADSHCWDQDAMRAECVCDTGYTDPGCATCADGFTAEGDRCVPQLTDDDDMLLTVGRDDRLHLAALSTSTGTLRLLRQVTGVGFGEQMVSYSALVDPMTGEVLAMIGGALGTVDLTSGDFTEQAQVDGINVHALTRGTDGTLYGHIGRNLVTIDPTTGATTEFYAFEATYPSIQGLAWRESTSTLLVVARRELHEVDPATGMATQLAVFDEDFAVYPIDVAVADNGELVITGWRQGDGLGESARRCRVMAWRITGDAAYLDAPGTELAGDGSAPITVASQGSGPEIIDLGIVSDEEIVIETSNPAAVVCMHPWVVDSTPTVRLTSGAQVGAVIIDRYNTLLEVDAGFTSDVPVLHMTAPESSDAIEPSLEAHPELVRLYDEQDWGTRALSTRFINGSALPNAYRHSAVVRLDAAASTVLEVIELPGVTVQSIEPLN